MDLPRTSSSCATLKEVFGWEEFRPGQEKVIDAILSGRSALAVFPTGSGKSLCYQLPALHLTGLTVVVSPLIALMKDQIDALARRGVPAARIDSSIGPEAFRETQSSIRSGRLKLLYVAPERFSNERFIDQLRRLSLSMLVVDEAHCISEWGHNFRPDYLKLARFARELRAERVLCLTATATPAVAKDICDEFAIEPTDYVHTGFHRPNLILRASAVPPAAKTNLLAERLRSRPSGPTVVYVTLQKTAEAVAQSLAREGFRARAYHAGMDSEDRTAVQEEFMRSEDAIVVATIAFGMGIDKADIRYVYHYNLPKSLENYSQEIGRAGRDGKQAICEILASASDAIVLENFSYGDTPEPSDVESLTDFLLTRDGTFDLSLYELSREHDMRPLVVNTLLTYLELEGLIESTAPFYTEYAFQPLKPSKEILAGFDQERADFLSSLFKSAKKGKIWFSLEIDDVARRLDAPRSRIVSAISYLEEKGELRVKVAGARQGYRRTQKPVDKQAVKRSLVERFETRERNDIQRVSEVLTFVSASECLVRRLLAYFGERLEGDCGHCGICEGEAPATLEEPNRPRPALDNDDLDNLIAANPEALNTPRRLTRFLCGISSPRLTRDRLNRHSLFGSLEEAPFATVLKAATDKLKRQTIEA